MWLAVGAVLNRGTRCRSINQRTLLEVSQLARVPRSSNSSKQGTRVRSASEALGESQRRQALGDVVDDRARLAPETCTVTRAALGLREPGQRPENEPECPVTPQCFCIRTRALQRDRCGRQITGAQQCVAFEPFEVGPQDQEPSAVGRLERVVCDLSSARVLPTCERDFR